MKDPGLSLLPVLCILALVFSAGCQSASPGSKTTISGGDPEIAIISWMDAMNRQDIPALYDLAPSSIRSNITLSQFTDLNRGNVYFTQNVSFLNYQIVNKTIQGNSADIRAEFIMRQSPSGTASGQNIPIWFHFTLTREGDEWKVWTAPW